MSKPDDRLFYTCSLIEYMAREKKLRRAEAFERLGEAAVERIYRYADVLHSEPIAGVAEEYERRHLAEMGSFDNVTACRYTAPDYWTMGKVFSRLAEDVSTGDNLKALGGVYRSFMSDALSDYNTDLYYQPRDYLRECYLAGRIV